MPREEWIVDPNTIDCTNIVADIEAIRKTNPQRYEMEQLTAIVYENTVEEICIGYHDLTDDQFWVRGHMPGMPILPGVLMCETAAQVSTWYVANNDLMNGKRLGFGGLDGVKFRGLVRPGDRLVLVLHKTRFSPGRMIVCEFQGFVDSNMVVQGTIRGIPLPDSL